MWLSESRNGIRDKGNVTVIKSLIFKIPDMENKEKENLKIVVEVKGENYNNGKLKTVFGGKGQISMRELGRILRNDTNRLTFRGSDCTPKIEAEYSSTSIGQGEVKTDVEIDVKAQYFDASKDKLIDGIAGSAKLTKADAGRSLDTAIEDIHKLIVTKNCEADCANIESTYETKAVEIVK